MNERDRELDLLYRWVNDRGLCPDHTRLNNPEIKDLAMRIEIKMKELSELDLELYLLHKELNII